MTIQKNTIKKILIVQTAFIGDVILITPLIRETKIVFPNSLVDVMVIPQAASLLENNPNIKDIILFDKRKNKFLAFLKTLTLLKKKKYGLAISPHSSMTTALLLLFSKIKIRVGFERWASQFLLTHKLEHIKNTLKIKKNLHLLSPFSNEKLSISTELFPTKEMSLKAENLIDRLGSNSKRIVAIAPGSNWFTKRWPEKHYAELVKKLHNIGYGIVFIGSKVENSICERIKPENNFVNLAGELSLLESAAVIKNCDLMICNDSGAMHIANAVNTDVITFFGPTVERIGYFPIRENDIVFQVDLECRPCSSHGTKKCPLDHHDCMKKITSDKVFDRIIKKFE